MGSSSFSANQCLPASVQPKLAWKMIGRAKFPDLRLIFRRVPLDKREGGGLREGTVKISSAMTVERQREKTSAKGWCGPVHVVGDFVIQPTSVPPTGTECAWRHELGEPS